MPGAGSFPAGGLPAGLGLPSPAPSTVGQVFPDPVTGVSLDGRQIVNGRYVFNPATGRAYGMTAGQQVVYLAFHTKRGSTGDPTIGERISRIQDIGQNFVQQANALAQEALADAIANKLVRFRGCVVLPITTPDGRRVQVLWTDLTAGTQPLDRSTFI